MPAETHVKGDPMGRDEVLTLVKDHLAEILEIEPSAINEGDAFADDPVSYTHLTLPTICSV